MGIEKFFNSIKKAYNIVEDIYKPYKHHSCNHFYVDFNSIIHITSKNKENSELIIKEVLNNVEKLIETNLKTNELKTIYLALDGVPSKAKMLEQRHRRYIGEMMNIIQYKLTNKSLSWSKNNITPGTYFMHQLCIDLKSEEFIQRIKKIAPNLEEYIVSDVYEPGEGEKKIMDHLMKKKINPNDTIIVYSPDADMILLTLLAPFQNMYILRYDQQLSEEDPVYNYINVGKLKITIGNYIKTDKSVDLQRLIEDIVFIFTIFGDDFLPKIQSYNVNNDIDIIIDHYVKTLNETDYLLYTDNSVKKINYKSFHTFLNNLAIDEAYYVKRNYYQQLYNNYNYILKCINKYINRYKTTYKYVDHTNIKDFIKDYNSSKIPRSNIMPKKIELIYKTYNINDSYHKKEIEGMDSSQKEIYKIEKLLNQYNVSKQIFSEDDPDNYVKYYKRFFGDAKISDIVSEYIIGLTWILDYYYNNKMYSDWSYPYHFSPLITTIVKHLTSDFLQESQKILYKKYAKLSTPTPIEQVLFITPFDIQNLDSDKNLLLWTNLIPTIYLEKIVKLLKSGKLKQYYLDINEIAISLLNGKMTKLNCDGAQYINKCWFKNLSDDYLPLIDEVRKIIPLKDQLDIFNNKRGGSLEHIIKYKYYKKKYLMNKDIKYKNKYKWHKNELKKLI